MFPQPSRPKTALALSVATLLVFVLLEISNPFFFLWDDNATTFLPYYTLNWRSLSGDCSLPFVNFHQYLGQNYLGQGQTGVLYPPVYLSTAISSLLRGDTLATIEIMALLHLWGAGIFAFLLLRSLGLTPPLAFGGTLLWLTNPFILSIGKSWVFLTYLAAYLPLVLWLNEKWLQDQRLRWGIFIVVAETLFFLQGYVQYTVYLVNFELAYFAFRFWSLPAPVRPWAPLIHTYILPRLALPFLTAPLLLPMVQTILQSGTRSGSLSWLEKLTAIANPLDFLLAQSFIFERTIFSADSRFLFLGPCALFLFLFLIPPKMRPFWVNSPQIRLFSYLGTAAFLFSSVLYVLIGWIPPYDRFRWPFKIFVFAAFATIIATSLAFSLLNQRFKTRTLLAILITIAAANLLVVTIDSANATFSRSRPIPVPRHLVEHIHGSNLRTIGFSLPDRLSQTPVSENYATYHGLDQFAGYDPIASKTAVRLTKGVYRGTIQSGLTPEFLSHMESWGVGFLFTENSPENIAALGKFPQLSLMETTGNWAIFKDGKAQPVVTTLPDSPLPRYSTGTNQIQIHWESPLPQETTVIINMVPCANISCFAENPQATRIPLPWKEENDRITLDAPQGTTGITIVYSNPLFTWGCAAFVAGILYLAVLGLLPIIKRRNTATGNPPP